MATTLRNAPDLAPAAVDKTTMRPTADRSQLVQQYLPYVRHIAGKVKRSLAKEIEYEDLVEYGMVGLFEAADRYDAAQGANFMTFAYYRIRGAIYDGLRTMGWLKRATYTRARMAERANAFLAEAAEQIATGGSAPPLSGPGTPAPGEAVGPEAASPYEQQVRDLAHVVTGLATLYITSLDGALASKLEDTGERIDEQLANKEARHLVRAMIKKLGDQERELLELYYYEDLSLQEVGDKMGLSKSWASRLHARAIDKLHRLLEDELGEGA